MRNLIRPTLFLVARLGLFLTVAAWIVGQWWTVSISTPPALVPALTNRAAKDHGVSVRLNPKNWVTMHNIHQNWPGQLTFGKQEFVTFDDAQHEKYTPKSGSFLGFKTFRHHSVRYSFFRHWLVVTIFALFNGVLIWVYRKRRKKLAADE